MSNYLLQIHVLIEVRRCGSCLVLHIKHPSIPKPVWHKLTAPMYCPFSSTFRRCIFVRQVELAPGRFVLPSGHARTQPARAFPAQTVKTGWTLLSTGSVVVLVLQALIQRFLPGFSWTGQWGRLGKGWKGKSPPLHGPSRRNTSRTSSIHLKVKLWAPLPSWWSVVPKALGNQPCWTISCVSMWRMAKGCFLLIFLFVLVRTWSWTLPVVKCQIFAGTGEWDVQAPNRQCRRGIPATHNQKARRQI